MVIGGRKRIFAAVAALLVLALAGAARADNFEDCGSLKNHYGPFDYTDPEIRAAKKADHPDSGTPIRPRRESGRDFPV